MFSILILQDDLTQSGTIKKIIEDKYPQWKVYKIGRASCRERV